MVEFKYIAENERRTLMPGTKSSSRISADKIRSLGFPWPHPHVPDRYVVTDEAGFIDLEGSLQLLERQKTSDEKVLADAHSFRTNYGGQMSVLEYSDFKDIYDPNRQRISDCRQAIRVLRNILDLTRATKEPGKSP